MIGRSSVLGHALPPALVALAAAAGGAGAHPHTYVDQQVLISIGVETLHAAVVIVPSIEDGASIHDHLDTDGDGAVSPEEAARFGAAVAAAMRLEVDGAARAFGDPVVSVSDASLIRAGSGEIRVEATAAIDLAPRDPHHIAFAITFDAIAHDWFVQPFYHADLSGTFSGPRLNRSAEGDAISVRLTPAV